MAKLGCYPCFLVILSQKIGYGHTSQQWHSTPSYFNLFSAEIKHLWENKITWIKLLNFVSLKVIKDVGLLLYVNYWGNGSIISDWQHSLINPVSVIQFSTVLWSLSEVFRPIRLADVTMMLPNQDHRKLIIIPQHKLFTEWSFQPQ